MQPVIRRAVLARVLVFVVFYGLVIGLVASNQSASNHPPWGIYPFFAVFGIFVLTITALTDRRLVWAAGRIDAPWTGADAGWRQLVAAVPPAYGVEVARTAVAAAGGNNVEVVRGETVVGWTGSTTLRLPGAEPYQLSILVTPLADGRTLFTSCARPRSSLSIFRTSKSGQRAARLESELAARLPPGSVAGPGGPPGAVAAAAHAPAPYPGPAASWAPVAQHAPAPYPGPAASWAPVAQPAPAPYPGPAPSWAPVVQPTPPMSPIVPGSGLGPAGLRAMALVLIVIGVGLVGTVLGLTIPRVNAYVYHSPRLSVPGNGTLTLEPGTYVVYEDTNDAPTYPVTVSVSSADGRPLAVTPDISANRIPFYNATHRGIDQFTIHRAGPYELTLSSHHPVHVVVAVNEGQELHAFLGWIGLVLVGVVVIGTGVFLLVRASSRRRREGTTWSRPGG